MQSDSNLTQRIGFADGAGDPPTNGIYLEKLNTDSNWFLVCRSGGSQTRADTGVAHAVGKIAFVLVKNGATDVKVYQPGNATAKATVSATIPADATNLDPLADVKPHTNAAKIFDLIRWLAVGKQVGY